MSARTAPKVLPDLVQGSDEWHAARRGIVTASVVGQLISVGAPDPLTIPCPTCDAGPGPCTSMARGKEPGPIKGMHDARGKAAAGEPPVYRVADSDTSRALTAQLVAERITGYTEPTFTSSDMWRGIDSEPIARDIYSETYGEVTEVGFMVREDVGWRLGYSPDGLVGADGLIEVKAPRAKTHVLTILADEVPARHMAQLQAGLLVSGRQWIDFVSFCGGLPMWTKRVHPDPRWFAAITAAVEHVEVIAECMEVRFRAAVHGLPPTERILTDLDMVT